MPTTATGRIVGRLATRAPGGTDRGLNHTMPSTPKEDIRCGQCRKLLARGRVVVLEIKCPRCGTINHLKAESLTSERH